jgi:SAM-dependent methyltransferase
MTQNDPMHTADIAAPSTAPADAHACPLCGGAGHHVATMPVDAITFEPTAHGRVYRCAACRFEYLAPRPTPEQTLAFYDLDNYYTRSDWQNTRATPGLLSRLRLHLAWRLDRSQEMPDVITRRLAPGASIVDIGCGDGAQMQILSQRGFRMTGVERDTRTVSLECGGEGDGEGAGPQVFEGSAEALPAQLRRGSFDAVMFKQVLEHLVDPVAALRRAAELLAPGGVLFCEVPNAECAMARRSGLSWKHMDVPRHLSFFGADTLRAAAERAGLVFESLFFNEYCRYFGDDDIAGDQRIFDHLGGAGPATRYSQAGAWQLLLRTAIAAPQVKYDCVGVVAVKPA